MQNRRRIHDTGSSGRLLAFSVLLTVVVAAPVLVAPTARLFGSELHGFHPDAYIVIEQMESSARLHHFTQPATDWVGILFARLVGGVAAYNLLILLTFPLTAWITYLLTRSLGLDPWPGALAALLFAFSPFHFAHAAYHPHISQIQWLPLYLLAIWTCVDRWTPLRGLLLAGAAGLLTLSNFYAGLIGAVVTPVAVLGLFAARHTGALRANARHLLATVATLSACATLGALYVWRIGGEAVIGDRRFAFPYEDLFRYCARWWSYLVPPVEHPLLGDWATGIWERHGIGPGLLEQQIFLGWSVAILAGIAVAGYLRGHRHPAAPDLVPALVAVALVAFVFSLPPEGRVSFLARPTAILHGLLPMFRAYARFAMAVQLAVVLLAALGLSSLLAAERPRHRRIGMALVVLAIVELTPLPPWRWHWVLPTAAHRWVEQQPDSMSILDCHDPRPGESWRLRRMKQRIQLPEGMKADCGEPALAGKLAVFGFTHTLVRSDYRLSDHVGPEGLETVEEFHDSRLLEIVAPPASAFVAALGGFSWREVERDATFRWMGQRGDISLVIAGHDSQRSSIELELEAFPRPRNLTLRLDGRPVGTLETATERTVHEIGPFELDPGRHVLSLIAEEPAVTPDSVLRNGDQRSITVALWGWNIRETAAER